MNNFSCILHMRRKIKKAMEQMSIKQLAMQKRWKHAFQNRKHLLKQFDHDIFHVDVSVTATVFLRQSVPFR